MAFGVFCMASPFVLLECSLTARVSLHGTSRSRSDSGVELVQESTVRDACMNGTGSDHEQQLPITCSDVVILFVPVWASGSGIKFYHMRASGKASPIIVLV